MAGEASRSSSSADSYIGSLISLTSKSEIRYEGVLYNINTDEASIGLRNVRSFGTEDRKKEGVQVPPSDKIYEYILFRGSDIKDLQVKSSPPAQSVRSINSDPAIIQPHYSHPASTSASLPAVVSGSLTDLSSHTAQLGHPGPVSTFQGGLPLYQPGGNKGSWGASPLPSNANGGGLAMPMYWQGFYAPSNGLPQLQQQSMLRPPPGLSMNPMQQPMPYLGFHGTVPTGALNLPGSNLPEFPPSLLPGSTNSPNVSSISFSSVTSLATLPAAPSATFASEILPSMPNKVPSSDLPPSTPSVSLPSLSHLTTSGTDVSGFIPPISNRPNAMPSLSLPFHAISQSISPVVGTSSSSLSVASAPSLITPGQLLQSRRAEITSLPSSQIAHKDVEVVQVSSSAEQSITVPKETQPPILQLPVSVPRQAAPKGSRPSTKFTEEFDFRAMNEKFRKDEVWGHLGKSSRSHSADKEEDGNVIEEEKLQEDSSAEMRNIQIKPVYNKDDFFDTLSCNALGRESQNGRPRFSEQMKLDAETFGDFPRHRGGRGGRGYNHGGRSRGAYNGRGHGYGYGYGYGYAGRGRGWGRGM